MSFSSKNKNNENKTCLEEYIKIKKFSKVKLKNKEADKGRKVLESLLLSYINSEATGINKDAKDLSKLLYKEDLEVFCTELFQEYIENDIFNDKKWVINFCAMHGGEDIIFNMKRKIYDWINNFKISIALDAIVSLCLNGNDNAFKVIEEIQRKCNNKEVKAIAEEAFNFAIDEFNMDKDEFKDSIVPYLGLDERGVHIFKYDNYEISIYLTKLFDFIIYDENKKIYKALPKIKGVSKEENLALRKYFKDFKVQLKNVTYRELDRLEKELSYNRKWFLNLWIDVFLKNPIMRTIGETFIWGIYHNSKMQAYMNFSMDVINNRCVIKIFHYKNNALLKKYEIKDIYDLKNKIKINKLLKVIKECEFNNKEFTCNINDYCINIVHPVDFRKNHLEIWKKEFEELNILQPVDQLYRKSFTLAENETQNDYIDRFNGKRIKASYILDNMNRFGWYKGEFNINGVFYEFYKKNIKLKIIAELKISGICIDYLDEDIVVKLLRFYRINGEMKEFEFNNINDKELLKNYEIPKRFFSEVLYDISNSLLKSISKDYNI